MTVLAMVLWLAAGRNRGRRGLGTAWPALLRGLGRGDQPLAGDPGGDPALRAGRSRHWARWRTPVHLFVLRGDGGCRAAERRRGGHGSPLESVPRAAARLGEEETEGDSPDAREAVRRDGAKTGTVPAGTKTAHPRRHASCDSPRRGTSGTIPILWREIRTWAYGRKILVIRLAYLLLFGLAAGSLYCVDCRRPDR